MSKPASPMAVGLFAIFIVLLAIGMTIFFGQGKLFNDSTRLELIYDSSVKGLTIGAPVTIRGVKIGEVISIKARMYTDRLDYLTSVTLQIDGDSIDHIGPDIDNSAAIEDMLDKGLAAQLRIDSMLTGRLFIDVDFFKGEDPQLFDVETQYPQFPTVRTDLEKFTEGIESLDLEKLVRQVEEITSSLNEAINNDDFRALAANSNSALLAVETMSATIEREVGRLSGEITPLAAQSEQLLQTLNRELPAVTTELSETTAAIKQTLERADYLLSDDSPQLYQLQRSSEQVEKAARAARQLAESLDRQPEALLQGKK